MKDNTYNVYYIDYKDGYVARILNGKNICFVEYSRGNPVIIEKESIVVIPLSLMVKLEYFFKNAKQLKFLIWSLNPSNLTNYIKISYLKKYTIERKKRKEIGICLKQLVDDGILYFMDHNNYYYTSKVFLFSTDVKYLPVYIDDFDFPQISNCIQNKNCLSFMWLGRLDYDKRNTIATYMRELEELNKRIRVKLLIVGSGDEQNYLEELSTCMSYEVNFIGKLSGQPLNDLIKDKVDIGLAMGLSAMEIAKMGKPVIIEGFLDAEMKAGILKDYICLCDSKGYDVVSPGYWDINKYSSFDEIVSKIELNYEFIAEACARYVYDNHTTSCAFKSLEEAIEIVKENYDCASYETILLIKKNIYTFKSLLIRKTTRLIKSSFVFFNKLFIN